MVTRTRSKEGTTRPFRLWNENEKKALPYRCYEIRDNAKWAALRHIMPRALVDTTITVYDAENGRVICQYTRKIGGVLFLGEKNVTAEQAEKALVSSAQSSMAARAKAQMGRSRVRQENTGNKKKNNESQEKAEKLRLVRTATG